MREEKFPGKLRESVPQLGQWAQLCQMQLGKYEEEIKLKMLLLLFIYQSLLRLNVDVSGQTKILWRGKTSRRNNLNEKQRRRGVDEVKNNNKRTGSSLGKLFNNVYI